MEAPRELTLKIHGVVLGYKTDYVDSVSWTVIMQGILIKKNL